MHSFAQQAKDSQDNPSAIVVNVNRVLIPVVVRDKQGQAVGDLKKEDFQVFDKDKPQTISGFTIQKRGGNEIKTESNAGSGKQLASIPSSAPEQPTTAPQRFIVFLFDDIHLSAEDLANAQKAGAKMLAGALADSDVAAVVSLSGQTNSGLIHLIENKRDSAALQDAVQQVLLCDPRTIQPMAESLAHSTANRVLAIGAQDVQATYTAIAEFVRRMANLPGQRTMILVSPGFISISPEALTAESQITDLAARSNVTISALDAPGLYTTNVSASEDLRSSSPQLVAGYRRSATSLAENPLAELAHATGGTYFHNSNDLDAGFKRLTEVPDYLYVLELPLDNVKPDGTIDSKEIAVLDQIAAWMKVNGEAIYETRPWKVYGEGPDMVKSGAMEGTSVSKLGAKDIRFTRNKANTVVYAIVLGWPVDSFVVKALGAASATQPGRVGNVQVLGTDEKLKWNQSAEGLRAELPKRYRPTNDYAASLRISLA
jgi:VWFA-related protein